VLLQGITTGVHSGQCVAAGVHAMVTTCHLALHRVLLQGFVSRAFVKGLYQGFVSSSELHR
jgi:hypothetical protein